MDNDDAAREIDALDFAANLEHFERLFNYVIARQASRVGITHEQLFQQVAEKDLRAVVRKAMDRFKPPAESITAYASWWVRQLVHRRKVEAGLR